MPLRKSILFNNQYLSCLYFNSRGLKGEIIDFEYELINLMSFPDIITVTETWFDSSIVISGYITNHYTIFRRDRNRHGVGVMILSNNNLCSKQLTAVDNSIQVVWEN